MFYDIMFLNGIEHACIIAYMGRKRDLNGRVYQVKVRLKQDEYEYVCQMKKFLKMKSIASVLREGIRLLGYKK